MNSFLKPVGLTSQRHQKRPSNRRFSSGVTRWPRNLPVPAAILTSGAMRPGEGIPKVERVRSSICTNSCHGKSVAGCPGGGGRGRGGRGGGGGGEGLEGRVGLQDILLETACLRCFGAISGRFSCNQTGLIETTNMEPTHNSHGTPPTGTRAKQLHFCSRYKRGGWAFTKQNSATSDVDRPKKVEPLGP